KNIDIYTNVILRRIPLCQLELHSDTGWAFLIQKDEARILVSDVVFDLILLTVVGNDQSGNEASAKRVAGYWLDIFGSFVIQQNDRQLFRPGDVRTDDGGAACSQVALEHLPQQLQKRSRTVQWRKVVQIAPRRSKLI